MATEASPGTGVSATTRDLGRSVAWGAGGGVIASLVMAMFAMIAGATYLNSGFFTPLYHIASTFIAPDAMMQSMQAAMAGQVFTFVAGPALTGAVIHMMVGAMYGALFGAIAAWMRLRGVTLIGAAMVWGLVVFAASTWIALPAAAALFGGGDPIHTMAAMVGYPTFVLEHVMYGTVLGLVLLKRAAR